MLEVAVVTTPKESVCSYLLRANQQALGAGCAGCDTHLYVLTIAPRYYGGRIFRQVSVSGSDLRVLQTGTGLRVSHVRPALESLEPRESRLFVALF